MPVIVPSAISCSTFSVAAMSSSFAFGAELPESDAILVETEDRIPATLEGAILRGLRREEHGAVDALEPTREHVRPEERLICVDADAPDLLLLRREQRSEPTQARDLEDSLRPVRDLIQRELLALRLIFPVLRVPPLDLHPGGGRCRSRLVAGDEAVDRRLLGARHRADEIPAGALCLQRGEVADEVADLLLPEEKPLGVRGFPLERGLIDIDDGELRVGERLRRTRDCITLGVADADDQVVPLTGERRHVGDVVGGGLRLDHATLDTELLLGPLEAVVGELVEPVVVELPEIGDQPYLDPRRRALRRPGGGIVVRAAARRDDRNGRHTACDQAEAAPSHCHRQRLSLVFDYES